MTTERVYSNGSSQRYPSMRKHTSEWQKKLLCVSITPTGSLTEWHLAFPYICTACSCNTPRNCLSWRLHMGKKKKSTNCQLLRSEKKLYSHLCMFHFYLVGNKQNNLHTKLKFPSCSYSLMLDSKHSSASKIHCGS